MLDDLRGIIAQMVELRVRCVDPGLLVGVWIDLQAA